MKKFLLLILIPSLAFGVQTINDNLDITGHFVLNLANPTLPQHAATKSYVDTAIFGGGLVSSVFGRSGAVVAATGDYTFAQIGGKPTTGAGYGITDLQPLDSDLTAIAALSTTPFAIGSLEMSDAAAFRTYIGAGTALTDNGQGGFVMFDETAHKTVVGQTLSVTLSGDQNDWSPTGLNYVDEANPGALRIAVNCGGSARIITGIAGGYPNRILILTNNSSTGAEKITLTNNDVASSAANRFGDTSDVIIKVAQTATYIYLGAPKNRWVRIYSARGNSGVTAGSYTNTNLTVNEAGEITLASNGSSSGVTSLTGTSPIVVSPTSGASVASLDVSVDHAFTASQSMTFTDATNAIVADVLSLTHNTSGGPIANFGTGILFKGKSNTVNGQVMGEIGSLWKTATDGTRSSATFLKAATSTGLSTSPLYIFPSGGVSTSDFNDPGTNVINAGGGLKVNNTTATAGTILQGIGGVFTATTFTLPASPGTSGNVLTSNGTNWISAVPTGGGGTPGGIDKQVQFNDAGALGGDPGLVWDKTNNVLTLTTTPAVNTVANGLELVDDTATVSNTNNQYSPFLLWRGHAWKSGAGGSDRTLEYRMGTQGTSASAEITGTMLLQSSIGGAAYGTIMKWFTSGGVSIQNDLDPGAGGLSVPGKFILDGTISPTALTGDVNDYSPTGQSTASTMRVDGGAADRNITGLASGTDGRVLTIVNIGTTNKLILPSENVGSTAANRILASSTISLDPNTPITLRYDGTSARWRPWSSGPSTGGGTFNPAVDSLFTAAQTITLSDSTTNSTSDVLSVRHNSTGTAANSFGTGILFSGEDSTTDNTIMGELSSVWVDATHASRKSALVFKSATASGLGTNVLRFYQSGYLSNGTFADSGAASFNAVAGYTVNDVVPTTGKILRSDGATYKDSAYTMAAPGTSGNVLTSDGTNWLSSAPSGGGSVSDAAFASTWNGTTTTAPSKNAVYDELHLIDTADNGTIVNAGTGFRIGGAAASGKILVGDGTNYVASTPTFPNSSATAGKIIKSDGTNWTASTETYPAPGTSGNVATSDGTNWTSARNAGQWDGAVYVTGTDFTTSNTTATNITQLVTPTLLNSATYEVEIILFCVNAADTNGVKWGWTAGGGGTVATGSLVGNAQGNTNGVAQTTGVGVDVLSPVFLAFISGTGSLSVKGIVTTRSTGAATIQAQFAKAVANTGIVKVGSVMRWRLAGP